MSLPRIRLASVALGLLLSATAVHAQPTRTWVSGVGDDANPCSRTAPCKTFAGALVKTAAGGEISALDPGGFGTVVINKSITLNGDGTLASVLASLVNGVTINAGPNDKVVLRNISINGVGNGLNGVRFLAGKSLVLDHVTIAGFTGSGVDMNISGTFSSLEIHDSTITGAPTGVRVANTGAGGALSLAALADVRIEGTTSHAVDAGANGRVTISNSLVSGNANGLTASASTSVINAEGNQLAFNENTAINAAASGAQIRLSNNAIYNNTVGIGIAGGATVASTGNNRVFANGSSAAPNGGGISQQ